MHGIIPYQLMGTACAGVKKDQKDTKALTMHRQKMTGLIKSFC